MNILRIHQFLEMELLHRRVYSGLILMDNYQIFYNIVELSFIPSPENLHLKLEPQCASPNAEIVCLTLSFPVQITEHFDLGVFSCVCSRVSHPQHYSHLGWTVLGFKGLFSAL